MEAVDQEGVWSVGNVVVIIIDTGEYHVAFAGWIPRHDRHDVRSGEIRGKTGKTVLYPLHGISISCDVYPH